MAQSKEYYAFISYKREDEKWAKWLQDKLEHYKFPTNLNGRTDLPKYIRPTFRDVTDLKPGLLAEEINNALHSSEWLIVVCSPRSAKSPWVCKEAQTFIDLGRADHIIPFVIDGKPFSNDPTTECYPEALLNLTDCQELLAANINEMGREAAAIKVVARMFNLRFDALWQRYEREKRRQLWMIISGSLFFGLVGLLVGTFIWQQKRQTDKAVRRFEIANWKMMENRARFVSERANELIDKGDSYLACLLALDVLPANIKTPNDKPYTPEAESVLRKACSSEHHIINGEPYRLVFSTVGRDDSLLVSFNEKTIFISEFKTGKCLREIAAVYPNYYGGNYGHQGKITSAQLSPDNQFIVSSSEDGTICIWDFRSGSFLKKLEGHSAQISHAEFSPDGKLILSASNDGAIDIWNSQTGQCLHTSRAKSVFGEDFVSFARRRIDIYKRFNIQNEYTEFLQEVSNVKNFASFSPDGKAFVSTNVDADIHIWDTSNFSHERTLKGHRFIVNAAVFSPNGEQIASSSWDSTIRLWDVKTGKCVHELIGHTSTVNYASYSRDGKYVVSASSDNCVKIWDSHSGSCLLTLHGNNEKFVSAMFSHDDNYIIACSSNGQIHVWNIEKRKRTRRIAKQAKCSRLTNDKKRALFIFGEDSICCLNIQTGASTSKIIDKTALDFSPDGNNVITAPFENGFGHLELLNISTRVYTPIMERYVRIPKCSQVEVSLDNKYLATSEYHSLSIWEIEPKKVIGSYNNGEIKDVVFSPDGHSLAIVSIDNTVKLLRKNGSVIHNMEGHTSAVHSIAFAPNGTLLVSASKDLRIWDIKSGKCKRVLQDNNADFMYASFSPNNKYIASISSDNSIMIWDVTTGYCLQSHSGFGSKAQTVNFSQDSQTIIVTFSNGAVLCFDFPPLQELIDETRERFKNRQLTPEERRKYYLE